MESPPFIHELLVNLGGPRRFFDKVHKLAALNRRAAGKLARVGVIFHTGSHKGRGFDAIFEQATLALATIIENSPPDVCLLIENSAGAGDHIGSKFAEIGNMIDEVDSDRIRVCLDTQHCFGAGYGIADPDGIEAAMSEFDETIGLERLAAVHANDSKVEFGSGVDRHENIGEGDIGLDGSRPSGHPASRTCLSLEGPDPQEGRQGKRDSHQWPSSGTGIADRFDPLTRRYRASTYLRANCTPPPPILPLAESRTIPTR